MEIEPEWADATLIMNSLISLHEKVDQVISLLSEDDDEEEEEEE